MESAITILRNTQSPRNFMETIKALTKEGKDDLQRKENELITKQVCGLKAFLEEQAKKGYTEATYRPKERLLFDVKEYFKEAGFVITEKMPSYPLFNEEYSYGISWTDAYFAEGE